MSEILSVTIALGVPGRPPVCEVVFRPGNRAEVIERFPSGEIGAVECTSVDAVLSVCQQLLARRSE